MNAITTLILVLGLLPDYKEEVGLGIIEVDIDKTKEIKIYRSKDEREVERIIRLTKERGEIVIEEKDSMEWLRPEVIWLDYSQFLFRYTRVEGNWIEIITDRETGSKRWVLKTETLKVKPWAIFLIENTTSIQTPTPVDIKSKPDSSSSTIRKATLKDCFEAVEVKGDWIKIRTNKKLECNQHPSPIEAGWIKWRDNDRLTISYSLTC